MKMKGIIISLVLVALTIYSYGQSLERQVIGSAGTAVQNSKAGLSQTVGEAITKSAVQSSIALTQGFQQAGEDVFTNVFKPEQLNATIRIYPNPATEILQISSNLYNNGITSLRFVIYDMKGSVVAQGEVNAGHDEINVSGLAASSYTLSLESKDLVFLHRSRFMKM